MIREIRINPHAKILWVIFDSTNLAMINDIGRRVMKCFVHDCEGLRFNILDLSNHNGTTLLAFSPVPMVLHEKIVSMVDFYLETREQEQTESIILDIRGDYLT